MKKIIVAMLLSLFIVAPCWAQMYCHVKDGQIIEGPMNVPFAWKGIPGINRLSAERLKTWGLWPYVIGTPPAYNPDTQYLTWTNVVGENAVTRSYTVHDMTAQQYCKVVNGNIAGGAGKIPTLMTPSEAALWFPYIPGSPPEHNVISQYTTYTNAISGNTVIRSYTVHDYPQDVAEKRQKIADAKTLIDRMSAVSEMSYAQIETYVRTTFSNLPEAQQLALVRLYKIVLAIVKRNDWSK